MQGDDTAGEILELPGNRQLKLFLEQFRVGSESIEHQHQHIAADFVDQQPVRFDVAFPGPRESAGKTVVVVSFGQSASLCQDLDNFEKFI